MIPLYKLEKLPRIQKLRKIAKIFTFAENRLCMSAEKNISIFNEAEFVFYSEAAALLAKDDLLSDDAKRAVTEAACVFNSCISANGAKTQPEYAALVYTNTQVSLDTQDALIIQLHRALNNVKHILHAETGRDQADWDFTCGDGRLDSQKRQVFKGMYVYMEDIRSPFNVGAMFRTAESFGVEKIILSPFCADPNHRRAERTAMGCIEIIPWERRDLFSAPNDLQENLQSELQSSLPVFALETGGIPLADFPFPRRGILITGSEELGVSPRALAAADASLGRVSIPCYGTKASLNVSVAFGIAVQAWAQRYI